MVYRILRIVIGLILLILLLTFIGNINPWAANAVAVTVTLFVLLLILFGSLFVIFELHERVSQWHFYRLYVFETGLRLRDRLKSSVLPFIHGGLIILTPALVLLVLALPYAFSLLAALHLVAASSNFSEKTPAGEISDLLGVLAVVIAIIALALTMLPDLYRNG